MLPGMGAARHHGRQVADDPLIPFLYRVLRYGDVSPGLLADVVSELETSPPFLLQLYERPDLVEAAAAVSERLRRLERPPIVVRTPARPDRRLRGFLLVLIVDESQAEAEHEALARVCRDFQCETIEELEADVIQAAHQAGRAARISLRRLLTEPPA